MFSITGLFRKDKKKIKINRKKNLIDRMTFDIRITKDKRSTGSTGQVKRRFIKVGASCE